MERHRNDTAQEKYDRVAAHLAGKGHEVHVCTHLRIFVCKAKHLPLFRVRGRSLYLGRDCIDYCMVRFMVPAR